MDLMEALLPVTVKLAHWLTFVCAGANDHKLPAIPHKQGASVPGKGHTYDHMAPETWTKIRSMGPSIPEFIEGMNRKCKR